MLRIQPVLHIIRWPNLLLVTVIQVLVYYKLILYAQSVLPPADLVLLVLITLGLTASGFVINDVYDTRMDRYNRPATRVAERVLSLNLIRGMYTGMIMLGALLAVWTAVRLDMLPWLWLYPLAVAGLWVYSYKLKCIPVIGNAWVALFGAGMIAIVAVPDWIAGHAETIRPELGWYVLFAFLSTWYREVVKDVEDVEGDALAGCHTFVVVSGIRSGKWMATFLALMLTTSLLLWNLQQDKPVIRILLMVLGLLVFGSVAGLWLARDAASLHRVSWMIKFIMLGGMLIVLCL